LQPTN
jgi:hypothetical protein